MSAFDPRRILEDFLAGMDRGLLPDFETLLREHPAHARELTELWQAECERLEALHPSSPMAYLAPPDADSARRVSTEVVARLSARGAGFDRYALRGELGQGGMGAVLRVWDEDLRRELAMKVTLEGASVLAARAEPSRLARFVEEAQVTSQLDHPGIVPVHELGLDPQGRLYFTMKLVRGRTFAQILDLVRDGADGWTQARALGVIQRVCEAMAYAHDKGVVHRDLKPANVMVGVFGEVLVMDWGLARVAGALDRADLAPRPVPSDGGGHIDSERAARRGTGRPSSLLTLDGQVVGTPAYMPPEQAAGRIEEVGPHSDVYAVGAMIYHLLAGRPPHEPDAHENDAVSVWRRIQSGPPAPLPASAPPELAAICAKAMAQDGRARYPDMLAMAADVAALLEGRVVRAHETGALADARKWVKRNRGFAASLAAGLLALVLGLLASVALKGRSDAHALRAQKIAGFLEETLAGVRPSVALGRDTTMLREMMDAARKRIEAGELAAAPEAEMRLAHRIGSTYHQIAHYELAEPLLRRAAEHARTLLARDDPLRAAILEDLGLLLDARGLPNEAEALVREALDGRQALHAGDHADVASSLQNLATVLRSRGEVGEVERLLRAALAMLERLALPDAEGLASALTSLAVVLEERGDLDAAQTCAERALALNRVRFPGDHPLVASNTNVVATLLAARGDLAGAEALHRETLEMRRRLHDGVHPETAASLNNLAFVLYERRDFAGAEQHFREALDMQRQLLGGDVAGDKGELASTLDNLAATRFAQGDPADGEALQLEALEMRRRLFPAGHPDLALGLHNHAVGLRIRGDFERAEPHAREALEMARRLLPADHPHLLVSATNLGLVLEARGDLEGAARLFREVLDVDDRRAQDNEPPSAKQIAQREHNLARVLLRGGRHAEAEEVLLRRPSATTEPPDPQRLRLLVELYGAWDRAEPGRGHDRSAALWQRALDAGGR